MAKVIMVQGTTSNAGKSLMVAGLCRIFRQDGYKVAPFKAQNMALNSYITKDGLEMGRAQVVQAEAAGCQPSVYMNPILLKPTSDKCSQVIVNGQVWQDMDAKEYYKNKKALVPEVEKAFNKLASENDIIVIEGAGSPAEINLKENDIVNMFMAKLAKAPVLLVGDIDRGGVFAALVGTMALFDQEEADLVKGLVINKFRGDLSILEPGLKMLEEKAGKPVVGVVPYMNVDIEDEDSLSQRLESSSKVAPIEIAVIKVPRISNFTDLNVFDTFEAVSVKYVDRAEKLGNPDLIVLPGTKNTMEDLKWLRQTGLEALIKKYAADGGPVFGICGGYQMLGQSLDDPQGVEHGGQMAGIGLLNVETVFEKEKTRTRVKGKFGKIEGVFASLSNTSFNGYEIHMGTTKVNPSNSLSSIWEEGSEAKSDGACFNNVYGSYVHGIFDGPGVALAIVKALMEKKGLDSENLASIDVGVYKEQQYDKLAEGLRQSLNMKDIYEILERGI